MYTVVMESELYGREEFGPYDTMGEAKEAIGRLVDAAELLADNVERVIGIVVGG